MGLRFGIVGNIAGSVMLTIVGSLEISWAFIGLCVNVCNVGTRDDAVGVLMLVTAGLKGNIGFYCDTAGSIGDGGGVPDTVGQCVGQNIVFEGQVGS